MNPVIKHEGAAAEVFAPVLQVLTAETVTEAEALAKSASTMEVTDQVTFMAANDFASIMHGKEKLIEARRVYLKAPLTATAKAIEAIVDGPASALSCARKALIGKIAAWDRKQKDAAEALLRKAREDAEAERQRLQAIADAEHAAAMKMMRDHAAAEAAELAAIMGSPVEPEQIKVVAAPVAKAAPVAVAAPVVASAVATRSVPTLVIDTAHPIFQAFTHGGNCLVTIDRAATKRYLESGAKLSWARMELVEQVVMKAVKG